MSKEHLRKRYFIDPKVQGALLVRTAGYWMFCLLTIASMLICWSILSGPTMPFYFHIAEVAQRYGPVMILALLLLPLVLSDCIRLSNRFTGPIYRLRRSMRNLAFGKHVAPLAFRTDDYWQEVADEFNAVVARLQHVSTTVASRAVAAENADEPRDGALIGA